MSNTKDALQAAITYCGTQEKLGQAIGVPRVNIAQWMIRGTVPAEWCWRIQKATDDTVTMQDLRPDCFGKRWDAA